MADDKQGARPPERDMWGKVGDSGSWGGMGCKSHPLQVLNMQRLSLSAPPNLLAVLLTPKLTLRMWCCGIRAMGDREKVGQVMLMTRLQTWGFQELSAKSDQFWH